MLAVSLGPEPVNLMEGVEGGGSAKVLLRFTEDTYLSESETDCNADDGVLFPAGTIYETPSAITHLYAYSNELGAQVKRCYIGRYNSSVVNPS